jgi:hypothetical protein
MPFNDSIIGMTNSPPEAITALQRKQPVMVSKSANKFLSDPSTRAKLTTQLSNLDNKIKGWDPKTLSTFSFSDVNEFNIVNRDALMWTKDQVKGDLSKIGLILCNNFWICEKHLPKKDE